jgi:hypothetical protein
LRYTNGFAKGVSPDSYYAVNAFRQTPGTHLAGKARYNAQDAAPTLRLVEAQER